MRIICFILVFSNLVGSSLTNYKYEHNLFNIPDPDIDTDFMFEGLPDNSIFDITSYTGTSIRGVFLGTGSGIGFVYKDIDWKMKKIQDNTFPSNSGNPFLKLYKDKNLIISSWVSAYFDPTESIYLPKGEGISWSLDLGETWNFKDQSVDENQGTAFITINWGEKTIKQRAITTAVSNVSYDIDIHLLNEEVLHVYTVNWAGSLRRFNLYDQDSSWEVVPMPMDDQAELTYEMIDDSYEIDSHNATSGGNENHKGFSVKVQNDTIWVGTSNGVNRGIINGEYDIDWTHFTKQDGLAGDWVTGIEVQPLEDKNRVWLVTRTFPYSAHGLTYSDDGGITWNAVYSTRELGLFGNHISFNSDSIYYSTSNGLYVNYIDNDNSNVDFWDKLHINTDVDGESILDSRTYGSLYIENQLFVGTSDGLAIYDFTNGLWEILRSFDIKPSGLNDDSQYFSAYPNPLYIDEPHYSSSKQQARFYVKDVGSSSMYIDIFDFNMDKVKQLDQVYSISSNESEAIWNGKNDYGLQCANGVYFCRLSTGGNYYWTKLVIVNSK